MRGGGFEVRRGVSLAATFEGEFSMSRGPYASEAKLGSKIARLGQIRQLLTYRARQIRNYALMYLLVSDG